MPILVNVQRYYGPYPVPTSTIDSPSELSEWLKRNRILPGQYDQILRNLGYTVGEAETALYDTRELTKEIILQEFQNL